MSIRALGIVFVLATFAGCEFIGTDEGNRDGTCGHHASCPSDQACGGGQCVDMLGRAFEITEIEVDVCNANLDGIAFDSVDDSSPDLQIELRFGGQTLFSSSVHENALSSTFALSDVQATLADFSDSFVVEVHDDDGGSHELMDTVSVDVEYPGVRAGEVRVVNNADCSESPVTSVSLKLAPMDGAW
jgi:hypothetical protein